MSTPEARNETSDDQSHAAKLLSLINSGWPAQALSVAAQFNIADLLATGPKTSEQLARLIGADAPSLYRLLRALVTLDIVREDESGAFALLPMGELLRSDIPESVRAWAVLVGRYHWPLWEHLLESIQSGESARKLFAGTEGFQHLEHDPEVAAIFNRAMVDLTRLIAPDVVRAYDFSGMKQIADIGGGYGELLAVILQSNPNACGVLLDLPHAIENGRRHLENAGVANRCEFVEGDFFDAVPLGADAYILKSILHDWDDEKGRVILENCARAMSPESKLLLIERMMPEHLGNNAADRDVARSDLNMLISLGAKERTAADFKALLIQAGLKLDQIIPIRRGLNILEATLASM